MQGEEVSLVELVTIERVVAVWRWRKAGLFLDTVAILQWHAGEHIRKMNSPISVDPLINFCIGSSRARSQMIHDRWSICHIGFPLCHTYALSAELFSLLEHCPMIMTHNLGQEQPSAQFPLPLGEKVLQLRAGWCEQSEMAYRPHAR